MKVICAGLNKTGTKTMATALRMLGYNVHDFFEQYALDKELWDKVVSDTAQVQDYQRILGEVDAITDYPGNGLWEKILNSFPDAKVILTIRSTEDEWIAGLKRHVQEIHRIDVMKRLPMSLRNLLMGPTFANVKEYSDNFSPGCLGMKEWAEPLVIPLLRARYRQHNAYVKATCPNGRLLVFNVKDGWEPLCKFLDLPIPDEPFPLVNIGAEIVRQMSAGEGNDFGISKEILKQTYARISVVFAALIAFIMYFMLF